MMDQAADYYAGDVGHVLDYLNARGITEQVARENQLGCVIDPLPGHDPYVGRLVIPYRTPAGVVDLRFRSISPDQSPKYLGLPGRHPRLFNTIAIADEEQVVGICEGELDALIATHMIGVPSVAVPGAQSWNSDRHPRVFRGFERVIVFADGDEAGRNLANTIARDVQQAVVVDMGDGMDVNDAYLTVGLEELRRRAGV